MAFTQADLDALDKAIASNKLEVRYADRWEKYRSMPELIQARKHVAEQLAAASRQGSHFCYTFATARGD